MSVEFLVESRVISSSLNFLISKSEYFLKLLANYSQDTNIVLPDWITAQSLILYLEYLEQFEIPKVNIKNCQKFLWICDFFKDQDLLEKLINEVVIPEMNADFVGIYLRDAYFRTQIRPHFAIWDYLFETVRDFTSKNVYYVFKHYSHLFEELDLDAIRQIILGGLDLTKDNFALLKKFKEVTDSQSLVDILDVPKNVSPQILINCIVQGTSSDTFSIDFVECELVFETDLYLRTYTKGKNYLRIWVDITTEINGIRTNNAITITNYSPNKILLANSISQNSQIKIYGNINYLNSCVMTELLKDPKDILSSISKIPYSMFLGLLSDVNLQIENEDIAFNMLVEWVKHSNPSYYEMEELIKTIRWQFVSLRCLVLNTKSYPTVRSSSAFASVFENELQNRLPKPDKLEFPRTNTHPRNSYKQYCKVEKFENNNFYLETLAELLLEPNTYEKHNDLSESCNSFNSSIDTIEIRREKNVLHFTL